MTSGDMARFGSLITAMITPFDEEGNLDVEGAAKLARWLAENGSDGLVVAGTTGEAPVLSDEEHRELFTAVREAVTVPVIAGTGTNDTRHSIERSNMAAECGVDALLVVTPYYSRPSQAGLAAHFRAVAATTSLPLILYDIPVRTGRKISRETMLALAHDVPNIVGVKDASANPPECAHIVAEAPPGFQVYSGDDSLTLSLMAVGAVGLISVASNWAPREMSDMIGAFAKGDVVAARLAEFRV